MSCIIPFAESCEMLLQPIDRIAERPCFRLFGGAIAARVIARGMPFGAIRIELDEGGAMIGPRAFRRPLRGGIDSEEIIAVDTQARQSVTNPARRKRRLFSAGDPLETRNGPLIVDDVQDHGRAVNGRKGARIMKITFRRGALADPGGSNAIIPL